MQSQIVMSSTKNYNVNMKYQ